MAVAAHFVHNSDLDSAPPPLCTASSSAGSALHTLANVATQISPQHHGSTADRSSLPVLVVQPAAAAAPPPVLSFFPPDSLLPATLASSMSSKAPACKRPTTDPVPEPLCPTKRKAAQDSSDEDEADDDKVEVEDYVGLLHVFALPPPIKKSAPAAKPLLIHQTGSFTVAPEALTKPKTLKMLPANAVAKLIINDLDLRSLHQAVEKKRQDIYFHVDKPLSSNPLAQMDNNTFTKPDHPDIHCLLHAVSGLHWDVGGDAGLGWAQIAPDNDTLKWLPLGSQVFTARTAIKTPTAAAAAKAAAATAAAAAIAAAPAVPIPPPQPVQDENVPPSPPANPYHYPHAHYPPPPPHPYAHPLPAPYPPAPACPP
ncbi:hypothetical protein EXIGLDRAFT_762272 [Exidia glandulosa HHB12029]|uniref:Uncharacterized protein n=1 Tax=Exidia glandulosa HHB12029 TaxID=1314781 RepID=A0A166BC29_EXIGL|nr:hypothetical protein EXIGLDRAFT_762272 [Exidia glandulosa HHB12029]